MKNEKTVKNLSENEEKNLSECSTLDERKRGLADAGVKPLNDDRLEDVAGGVRGFQDFDYELGEIRPDPLQWP